MEMMKLYKEHRFNPLSGCLPMLIQLPLFIGLYWAISSPHFMVDGDPVFLNVVHLKHTGIVSHSGLSGDGKMNLASGGGGFLGMGKDMLVSGASMVVTLKNGNTLEQNIPDTRKALTISPQKLRPGVPAHIRTSFEKLGLEGYEGLVHRITLSVVNEATKETETLTLTPEDKQTVMTASMETIAGKTVPHMDILLLVVLFALTMLVSQRMMTAQNPVGNEQQQAMMKIMPMMFTVLMFVFPIPAGVLLYMDTNSLFQIFQTWVFQRQDATGQSHPPSQAILDIKPDAPGV
jgi:YidC/Oxa1 family membrane protein insertase